jgi:pimeloyl-ACP methyl ester carboxylesterase
MFPEAAARFDLTIDDTDSAQGLMTQGPAQRPIKLQRLAPGQSAGPARPQNPRPPFPYASLDVTFTNPITQGTLAATLTLPPAKPNAPARHPAVVLISGSGPQDRDGTILAHKPFWILADALTRAGVAVLRVDDPGVGQSTNPYGTNGREGTTERYVDDVMAAVNFLATRPEIDPKRIGLIGHSEGGLIAPLCAARNDPANPAVAFVVMLAGTGVPGREVLSAQLSAINRAAGLSEAEIKTARDIQLKALDLAASDRSEDQLRAELKELADEISTGDKSLDDRQRQALLGPALAQPWVRAFVRLDPRPALRKVRVPVLALQGSDDLQVVAAVNIPEITRALLDGGNPDVTIAVVPRLNHLLQPIGDGTLAEYATIETTIDLSALDTIVQWVVKRAGPAAP